VTWAGKTLKFNTSWKLTQTSLHYILPLLRRDSILPPLNDAYGANEIADDAEEDIRSLEVIPLRYLFNEELLDKFRNGVKPLTFSVNDTSQRCPLECVTNSQSHLPRVG
jgi:hypothetical protein